MSALFNLAGKVALVTGATSGIGRRQALALAAAGGRAAAAGINTLPEEMLGDFIDRFNATYA